TKSSLVKHTLRSHDIFVYESRIHTTSIEIDNQYSIRIKLPLPKICIEIIHRAFSHLHQPLNLFLLIKSTQMAFHGVKGIITHHTSKKRLVMGQYQHSALANGEIEIIRMAFYEFPDSFTMDFRTDIEVSFTGYGHDGI